MKDIGYYAGFLTQGDQERISQLDDLQLLDLLSDISLHLYQEHEGEFLSPVFHAIIFKPLPERDQIALIRGLCDRIELKLIEEASNG